MPASIDDSPIRLPPRQHSRPGPPVGGVCLWMTGMLATVLAAAAVVEQGRQPAGGDEKGRQAAEVARSAGR